MIFLILISLIILLITYFLLKRKRNVDLGNKIPGPRTIPLLGNGHSFLNKSTDEIFEKLKQLHEKYGNIYRLWMGPSLWIVASDPKDVEFILTNPKIMHKSDDYNLLVPWLGDGLLISHGKKWFRRRKAITPAFHFKILEQFVDVFNRQTNIFVKILENYGSNSFDIYPHVSHCALDIICETAMGTTANAQGDSESLYLKAVKDASHVVYLRMFNAITQSDIYFNMTRDSRVWRRSLKVLHEFTEDVIIKRRDELLKTKSKKPEKYDEDYIPKKKMALMDVLLQCNVDGKNLTNDEIRAEVDTFIFAGHDTTSSGISFAIYNIAKYPEIQETIFAEIKEITGSDKNKPITYKQLNELKYLDLVIKESMRVHPPIPYIGRQIKEEIEINGKIIPADTNVSIGVYLMNHNPELFNEPEKFNPERFNVETTAEKTNPFSYVPFSAGPRNCIGQKFAMLEVKSIIVKILKNFEVTLADGADPILIAEIVLKSKNGINVTLKPRVYK